MTVNTGSPSLRAGLYAAAPELAPLFSCRAEARRPARRKREKFF
ncbi:MAG: hypothetical protein ACRD13_05605 [Terriglobales bacterium]